MRVAAHTHTGFVFDAGIRDQEENREIPNFNGFYRGYDPSAWADMELTGINVPVRIGRAIVLPGDLVLAKPEGVLFIPAILAEDAISHAEFTSLTDDYNFELNQEGKNGARIRRGMDAGEVRCVRQVDRRASREVEDAAQRVRCAACKSQTAEAGAQAYRRAGALEERRAGSPGSLDNQRRLQHRLRVGDVVKISRVAAAPGISVNRARASGRSRWRVDARDRSRANISS